jgi:type I restriction enzyme S subunit
MSWEVKRIGDVCQILNGGTPKTGVPQYWDGDIAWITPKDMGRLEDIYVTKTERQISAAGMQNSSAKLLPPGSIILSTRAPIGHLAINEVPMTTNQGCKGLVLNGKADNKYLYYYLEANVELLDSLGSGTTFKELAGSKLADVPLPLPSLPEQQRIVGKLDAAFAALTEAQAHVERNRANARELFESYLNGVFEGKGDGWVEKTLQDICDVRDGTHASPKYHSTGFALVTSKNLKPEGLELENVSLISEDDFNEINRRSKVDKGDVLFAMIGTIGNPTVIEAEPSFAIKNVALFKCGATLDGRFLRYALLTSDVKERMRKEAKGTTQRFVGLGYLRSFRVAVPGLNEQRRIVTELDALNERTRALETTYQQKLSELAGLKKAVLGAAFRGEL